MTNNTERKGIIYKTTNKITGKSYIGLTVRSFDSRIRCHLYDATKRKGKRVLSHFQRALRKYEITDWEWTVLENDILGTELNDREVYYIDLYNSYHDGYNSTKGGDGGTGTYTIHRLYHKETGWIETTIHSFSTTYNISISRINRVIYKQTIECEGWSLGEDVVKELTEAERINVEKIKIRREEKKLRTEQRREEKKLAEKTLKEKLKLEAKLSADKEKAVLAEMYNQQRLKERTPNKAKKHTIIFEGKILTDTLRGFKDKYGITRDSIYYAKGKKGRNIPKDYFITYIK